MLQSKKIATIISYLNLFTALLSTLFFIPFLLKKVGDDYGVFSFSESIISWLTMLSTTFASCYVRFATIEEKRTGKQPSQTNTIFILLLLLVSIISLLAGGVVFVLFRFGILSLPAFSESEIKLFYIVFLLAIIHCSLEILLSFFSLFTTYKKYFVVVRGALLLNSIFYPLLAVVALLFGKGMLSVIIIMFAVKIFFNIVVMIFAFCKLRVKFSRIPFNALKPLIIEILIFSFFILINTIVETCNISLDKLLLGTLYGAHIVTIYQLGMTYTTYINSISCAMTNNFIPEMHQLAQDKNIEGVNSLFNKISSIQFIILVLVIGGYLSCGYEFTILWIGEENIEVFYIAISLMIAFAFEYSTALSIEYQRSINKHKFRAIVYLISLVVHFGITIILLFCFKSINPIISCLVGTIISEVLFKCIVLPIYNSRKLSLNYKTIFIRFLSIILIAFISFAFSKGTYSLIEKNIQMSNLLAMIVKGLLYVMIYLPSTFILSQRLFGFNLFKLIFRKKNN